ncbi:MAG: N-acetylmuramoyl-L-alanine amidase [Bacteroidetes bacterium]|nr:N-acetylmuramoyl-L-alanine amidase [Bacteroidota bacterium]MBS1632769.1 N-acetylmuramoyl-L-alanine amidase [Bacteroidota bacterium]
MKNFFTPIAILAIACILNACSHNPYVSTNRSYKKQAKAFGKILAQYPVKDSVVNSPYWIGTTNFNMRKPNFVIIHHTAQNSCDQTLKTFTTVRTQVSAHYVICKDGTVHHMLNDYLRAWQAGISKWGNATDINSLSIGIEIDNNGFEPFTEAQINSLLSLLERLKKAYGIPTANFIGHSDIAPGRKVDPNRYFPWQKLSENGFGYWYDTTGIKVPANFNALQALRIIGYNISKPEAAVYSFKLHFVQSDSSAVINEADKKILYELEKKYQ